MSQKFTVKVCVDVVNQDTPHDAAENAGIEGKRAGDPYAGSSNGEYLDEYDDGWFVGNGHHKGKNPQGKDYEEEDAVEVSPRAPL